MLGSKIHEIISISYDVCGAGKYCEEVRSVFKFWWLKALAERGNAALKRCSDWLQVRNCSECRDILLLEERLSLCCLVHEDGVSLLLMRSALHFPFFLNMHFSFLAASSSAIFS